MHIEEGSPCLLFRLPPELFRLCCTAFTPKNVSIHSPRQRTSFTVDRVVDLKDVQFLQPEEEGEHGMMLSYLEYSDWRQLDMALTNRTLRSEYLRMIQHTTISFPKILSLQYSYNVNGMMQWISKRELQLNTLYLTASMAQQLQLQPKIQQVLWPQVYKLRCETPNKDQCLFTWNLIAKDMPSVTLLDFTNNQKLTSSALKQIMKHCPHVTSLTLSACKYIKDNALSKIAVYANHLQYFDVSKCNVSHIALVNFVKTLPNLVSLNVTSCRFSYKQIAEILEQRPQLQELLANYPECSYANQSKEALDVELLVTSLSRLGPHLVSLSLKNCRTLQDAQLVHIVTNCRNLKKLSLEGCCLLSDIAISKIGFFCEGMVALDLRNCGALSDEGVLALLPHLSVCKDLAIDGCYKLTDRIMLALQSITNNNPSATSRSFLRVTFTHCPRVVGFAEMLLVQR